MPFEVQFEGHRYSAVTNTFRFSDGHEDSCVILIPAPGHPSASFYPEHGNNSVELSGHRFRFVGCRVGITNERGDRLTLLRGLFPSRALRSYDSFKLALLRFLKMHGRTSEV